MNRKKPVRIGTFTRNVKIHDDETGQHLQLTPYELRCQLRKLTRSGNPAVRAKALEALAVVEAVGARH